MSQILLVDVIISKENHTGHTVHTLNYFVSEEYLVHNNNKISVIDKRPIPHFDCQGVTMCSTIQQH